MTRLLAALALLLTIGAGSASAQVTFDAVGTNASTASGTSLDLTTLTVGSGTNRALVAQACFCIGCGTHATSVALTWDNGGTNQAMTQIQTVITTNGQQCYLFGLVAPTSGAKTLHMTWTGSGEANLQAVSWTGVDQTGSTTTFAHNNTATGNSTSASVTITSAVNNATMAACATGSAAAISSVNNTQTFLYHGSGPFESGGNRAAGAATVTHTCTLGGTDQWGIVGVDIVAVGGGGGATSHPCSSLHLLGVGCDAP